MFLYYVLGHWFRQYGFPLRAKDSAELETKCAVEAAMVRDFAGVVLFFFLRVASRLRDMSVLLTHAKIFEDVLKHSVSSSSVY